MADHTEPDSQRVCRNCNYPIPEDAVYCPKCSQKYTTGKVPVWNFVKEFFSEQLNLDSKLFLTIYALFIPGRLTNEYFKGKHKSYASPLRIFLVTAILLFATVSFITSDFDFQAPNETEFIKKATNKTALYQLDSLMKKREKTLNEPLISQAYDSLYFDFKSFIGSSRDSITLNNILGDVENKQIKLSMVEFAENSSEEIVEKYCKHIDSWFEKMLIKQQAKSLKDGKGLIQYFFGKLTFILFLMMPFLALILKLLYIRRDFYYVEHLIFSFHYHAFAFFVVTLIVIFGSHLGGWMAIPITGIFVYQFIAMKKVYQQSYFKTFLKFWVLFFLYQFLAIFFFVLAAIVSLLLF